MTCFHFQDIQVFSHFRHIKGCLHYMIFSRRLCHTLQIMQWKELFIRFTASAFLKLPSIYVFSYFPFGFEGRVWDLIVSVPDHCLSFYFSYYTVTHDLGIMHDKSWGIELVLFAMTKSCHFSQSACRSLKLMSFQAKQEQGYTCSIHKSLLVIKLKV